MIEKICNWIIPKNLSTMLHDLGIFFAGLATIITVCYGHETLKTFVVEVHDFNANTKPELQKLSESFNSTKAEFTNIIESTNDLKPYIIDLTKQSNVQLIVNPAIKNGKVDQEKFFQSLEVYKARGITISNQKEIIESVRKGADPESVKAQLFDNIFINSNKGKASTDMKKSMNAQ